MGNVVGVRENVFTASSEANGWESTFTWNAFNSTWCGGVCEPPYYVATWHDKHYVEFVSVENPTEKTLGIKLGKQWLRCFAGTGIELTDWTSDVDMNNWYS